MRLSLFRAVFFSGLLLLSNSNSVQAADSNIAPLATVTASSENVDGGQTAIKTVDGVAEGYPSNRTAEWRTKGQKVGAWLNLVWSSAHTIDRVVLYDRPEHQRSDHQRHPELQRRFERVGRYPEQRRLGDHDRF